MEEKGETPTRKLEIMLDYMHSLEERGFRVVEESGDRNMSMAISSGYIPHGRHSENWDYYIRVSKAYLLDKENQRFAVVEGRYKAIDIMSPPPEGEKDFQCIALLELPKEKNLGDLEKRDVQNGIKEFFKVVNGELERKTPWWFKNP